MTVMANAISCPGVFALYEKRLMTRSCGECAIRSRWRSCLRSQNSVKKGARKILLEAVHSLLRGLQVPCL